MPSMKKQLREAFKKAVEKTGEIELKLDQQKSLKKEWGVVGVNNKGVCQGICLCRAGIAKQGIDIDIKSADGRKQIYAFANQAQQYFEDVGQPNNMDQVGRMYGFLGRNFDLGLKCIREFPNAFDYPKQMAEFAWPRAPGYFQILLPNHVVSFHLADDISYFDPNVGVASFTNLGLLTKFLESYHMSSPFKESYGTEFGQGNPPPLFLIGME